jgi:hypothetical protein
METLIRAMYASQDMLNGSPKRGKRLKVGKRSNCFYGDSVNSSICE